jgi:hypothetical protein
MGNHTLPVKGDGRRWHHPPFRKKVKFLLFPELPQTLKADRRRKLQKLYANLKPYINGDFSTSIN